MATTAEPRTAMEDVRVLSQPLQAMVEWVGDLGFFCWRVAKAVFSRPFEGAEFLRQLDAMGAKSLPLVALAGAATQGRSKVSRGRLTTST
jgi:ABC-type transporter Mla maintaining outer membrane lipid asymmetry permease subunit MlaE